MNKSTFEPSENLEIQSLTPLYGFLTDAERLIIGEEGTVVPTADGELETFEADDDFLRHLELFRPGHLLRRTITVQSSDIPALLSLSNVAARREIPDVNQQQFLYSAFISPLHFLFRALHLFKRGRFVAGDTSFFLPRPFTSYGTHRTLMLVRCSEMAIDFQFLNRASAQYEFHAIEVPFFAEFFKRVNSAWPIDEKYPQLELAMQRYARESSSEGDPVDLISSLEGLLVQETEGVSHKLALNVANLIEHDANVRKQIYRELRELYGVRSRLVHGSLYKSKKGFDPSRRMDWLREITRRTVLSVLGLTAGRALSSDMYTLLTEMSLDDSVRQSVQERAACLLHIDASAGGNRVT